MNIILSVSITSSIIAIVFSYMSFLYIKSFSSGSPEMKHIATLIHSGAKTFLHREYKIIAIFTFVISIMLMLVNIGDDYFFLQSIAFIAGSIASGLTGYFGMSIATQANVKTTECAKQGLRPALTLALMGGSVMGMSVVGISLLFLSLLFITMFYITGSMNSTLHILTGFSMGASLIALFSRVGGGIFTKAADISADLVGKIETGIPEDDPRNPAVIADNVGDNVGDVAGMGADLCESYVGVIISTMIIGSTIECSHLTSDTYIFVTLPLLLAATGIITSVLGILFIKYSKDEDPQRVLNNGSNISVIFMLISACLIITYILPQEFIYSNNGKIFSNTGICIAIISGVLTGVGIGLSTEYYCSKNKAPVNSIVNASSTGHATNIIAGIGLGMRSTFCPILLISLTIICSNHFAGIYGIALSALGMLSTVGLQLAIDAYGPIADNAGGIAVMANMDDSVRKITDQLDAVGNTTAAIGKGFAIGSAALTAFALFNAYQSKVYTLSSDTFMIIDISKPHVVSGMFLGGMLPFLFSSLTIDAVRESATTIIEEIRLQFRDNPEILSGKMSPDYHKCIDISTIAALKGMVKPGLLAVLFPILGGLIDKSGLFLAGLLIGSTVTGVLLAIFMSNSGGAWDNAKKQIEEQMQDKKNDSDAKSQHAASVTGDTVGDPFKDTAGPSINILIKLMSMVALLNVPMMIKYGSSLFI